MPVGAEADVSATPLRVLAERLGRDRGFVSMLGRASSTVAVAQSARPFVIAGLATLGSRTPVVVVTATAQEAERYAQDVAVWLGAQRVALFAAWETLPFERVSPATETMGRRLAVLEALKSPTDDDALAADLPEVIVAPIRALMQRISPDACAQEASVIRVSRGERCDLSELASQLVAWGYRREHQVEHRGEFAVRGGIVDAFCPTADAPVRIDLWGDAVDRLTQFSVADQRSVGELDQTQLYPAREMRPDAAMRERAAALATREPWCAEHMERLSRGELFDGMESWLPWLACEEIVLPDLLGPDALVLLCEPGRLADRAADITAETDDLTRSLAQTWGVRSAGAPAGASSASAGEPGAEAAFPRLHVSFDRLLSRCPAAVWSVDSTSAPAADGTPGPQIETESWVSAAGDPGRLVGHLRRLIVGSAGPKGTAERPIVVVAAEGDGSAARLRETLGAEEVPLRLHRAGTAWDPTPGGHVVVAPLDGGFIAPAAGVAVLPEAELTGRRRTHRAARRRAGVAPSFEDLSVGDFVVHHHHGIARFAGLTRRAFGGDERDYLELEFRGTDRLYLPTEQIELIRPYIGGETPRLSRMGGSDFQRQKAKVRAAVAEIAQELVVLYQRRITTTGNAFDPDGMGMAELAESFDYVPTPDQRRTIDEVLADMADSVPMDRLVCGDVGFGKTEVAVRAAFCAVSAGKQAAVLVPTTLLARQHHQTFAERYADHPVRVEMLSRFLTPGEQRAVLAGIADGTVDVVIGTHRLLSGDVEFKSLGLLVIDEEQRFGVSHKEAIKHLRAEVDVLTLTATPIPRTLEMALTGIRNLSLLQTPPAERQPILTHVGPYDERAVSEAIRRELLREGQVFFVHNRVADIDVVAGELAALVPEARIAVAHGQMDEGTLEQVVIDFWDGAYDVLVCTTIIESGIDMPSVNTLVVDRADLLGLGQLHQIRGRVGRSGQRAYAYLFHPETRSLSEEAYERLRTIGESTELGSGYRIAMRDLQLRGAGNLLSGVQSGHIAAVGYDLYCELVSEAVAALSGETPEQPPEIVVDLPLVAHLPDDYVADAAGRLEAYRRLGAVTTLVEVADIEAEWADRYGPIPDAARTLLHIALLRVECHRLGMRSVGFASGRDGGRVRLGPLLLTASEELRMRRICAGTPFTAARYKPDAEEVQLSVRVLRPETVGHLFAFCQQLRPPAADNPTTTDIASSEV
ncbi:transcription-repair coupling factor [Candidatus Poriferisodalis sp.]|uniref:transcription-repair coupling factor n=1 Tax=Candidatus Poriferisodalis sp. TaxID=3101277 RepID=UPI003B01041A